MNNLLRSILCACAAGAFYFVIFSGRLPQEFAQSNSVGPLRIHQNGRFFADSQGNPFFWLGDTPWLLHARLLKEDVLKYLDTRQAQGFNVLQIMGTRVWFNDSRDAFGNPPFDGKSPLVLNAAYHDYMLDIIKEAASRGFYCAIAFAEPIRRGGKAFYHITSADTAYGFGNALGKKYRDVNPSIVWLLGFDYQPDSLNQELTRNFAEGIADGVNGVQKMDGWADYSTTMMSYYARGWNSSSNYFHQEEWLDFNWFQSSHGRRDPVFDYIAASEDWMKTPAKPVVTGEFPYEDHYINWDKKNGRFTPHDVRRSAYRGVFAGAAGATYGNINIFLFYQPGDSSDFDPTMYWYDALKQEAGNDMQHLKNLLLSRPFFVREPAPSLVDTTGQGTNYVSATKAADGSYGLVYFPNENQSRFVHAMQLRGGQIKAWWYNPRDGECYDSTGIKTDMPFAIFKKQDRRFTPPQTDNLDWVLVLDNGALNFGKPGKSNR